MGLLLDPWALYLFYHWPTNLFNSQTQFFWSSLRWRFFGATFGVSVSDWSHLVLASRIHFSLCILFESCALLHSTSNILQLIDDVEKEKAYNDITFLVTIGYIFLMFYVNSLLSSKSFKLPQTDMLHMHIPIMWIIYPLTPFFGQR